VVNVDSPVEDTAMLPMHERLMDEAFEMGGPADEGDLYGDMDPRDAEDYYGRGPCKCPIYDPEDGVDPGRGCRKCNPPMFDCKPGVEGIDKYKDPAFLAANAWTSSLWIGGPYRQYEARTVRREMRDKTWAETTTHNAKLERASEAYEEWAKNALATINRKAAPHVA
jgi:hypothetical protein